MVFNLRGVDHDKPTKDYQTVLPKQLITLASHTHNPSLQCSQHLHTEDTCSLKYASVKELKTCLLDLQRHPCSFWFCFLIATASLNMLHVFIIHSSRGSAHFTSW